MFSYEILISLWHENSIKNLETLQMEVIKVDICFSFTLHTANKIEKHSQKMYYKVLTNFSIDVMSRECLFLLDINKKNMYGVGGFNVKSIKLTVAHSTNTCEQIRSFMQSCSE